MTEAALIKAILTKKNLEIIIPNLNTNTVGRVTSSILLLLAKYFDNVQCDEVTEQDFYSWLALTNKVPDKKELQAIKEALENSKTVPAVLVKELLEYHLALDLAMQTRQASEQFILGHTTDINKIKEAVDSFNAKSVGITTNTDELFVEKNVANLISSRKSGAGLDWRLQELNVILGPLRKGDLIVLGARPETGKTTLIASEVTYMAKQLDDTRPVLWVCNEEMGSKVQMRIYQAALGWTKEKLEKDTSATEEALKKALGSLDAIHVLYSPYITKNNIEHVCRSINPGMIVIDQMDKIEGFRADRQDLVYKAIYQWGRVLASQYGPVIAVSQCDSTAEGQKWLTMNQLDGSKTAKQGEADAIILIGKENTDNTNDTLRYISVPKNKLDGGPYSVSHMRHGNVEVNIEPEIARYSS